MARKKNDPQTKKLFPDDQRDLFEKSYGEKLLEQRNQPVKCLGMTFENDEARREYFLEKLREKLKDPEFRKIEGFPIGEDEDILALSDPPYYTACPNPFIVDFIKCYGKPFDPEIDSYHREPFAADVSEGKTATLYTAHAYHTKVPHKAIMRYILHYTDPEDIVFDGFCGTGMAGIAAQLCGDRAEITSLGYRIGENGLIFEDGRGANNEAISMLGPRRAILNDLSPIATFIASNYSAPFDTKTFEREARNILKVLDDEYGWMYETVHIDGKTKGRINYTVWSDVFACAECSKEIVFVDEALAEETGSIRDTFPCPHCGAQSNKSGLSLLYEAIYDQEIGRTVSLPKRVPVLINYTVKGEKYEKTPDQHDLEILERIAAMPLPETVPTLELPDMQMRESGECSLLKFCTSINSSFSAPHTALELPGG